MSSTTEQDAIIKQAQAIAQAQGRQWDARLGIILQFCLRNPKLFPVKNKLNVQEFPAISNDLMRTYLTIYINDYYTARERIPQVLPTSTVPDPAVDTVLKSNNKGLSTEQLKDIEGAHRLSMAAENLIGELLERYIAQTLEVHGWVWCCGATVRVVDFVRITEIEEIALQVKNRSNSENSASAKVRVGTKIKKWHRINSGSGRTRWNMFPENSALALEQQLSEEGFQEFIQKTIQPRIP